MKQLKTFFEAKSVLAKLNQPKNWRTLPCADRREVRRLHSLRTLTRGQREYIAKIEASL
jgi:hypothetical protein